MGRGRLYAVRCESKHDRIRNAVRGSCIKVSWLFGLFIQTIKASGAALNAFCTFKLQYQAKRCFPVTP